MIHVIATIEAQAGQRDALLAEIRPLAPLVRAEAGCLEYSPALDIATGLDAQLAPRPNVIMIVEKWESVDHLKAHLASPHVTAFIGRTANLVLNFSIVVLRPA